jgi:hypothetical protein
MRRSEWIVGGVLGLIVVAVLLVLLAFWLRSRPQEEDFDINNLENLTALEAYNLAQPAAREWSGDAVMMTATAGWQPRTDFTDGRASWNFVFYSDTERATAVITVADAEAQLIRTRPQSNRLQTGDLAAWQVDSPAAIEQLLQIGADEFMARHAAVNLVLTLDNQGPPTWKSTFLDTVTKETFQLNITADTGEFTP